MKRFALLVALAAMPALAWTKLGFGSKDFSLRAIAENGTERKLAAANTLYLVVCQKQRNLQGDVTLCGEATPPATTSQNRAIVVSCAKQENGDLKCCASGPPTTDDPAGWEHCLVTAP